MAVSYHILNHVLLSRLNLMLVDMGISFNWNVDQQSQTNVLNFKRNAYLYSRWCKNRCNYLMWLDCRFHHSGKDCYRSCLERLSRRAMLSSPQDRRRKTLDHSSQISLPCRCPRSGIAALGPCGKGSGVGRIGRHKEEDSWN